MTARTVYAITEGEYSDFRVIAVFERREDAELHLQRFGDNVQELMMFGPGDDPSQHRYQVASTFTWIDADGTIEPSRSRPFLQHVLAENEAAALSEGLPSKTVTKTDFHGKTRWSVSVTAPTQEAAEKALRERAAKAASLIVQGLDPAEME